MSNNVPQDINANYKKFNTLEDPQQALVAATLVERMLPNYLLFCQVTDFGDEKVMRDALDVVWEKQIVKNLKLNIDKQLEKIEPNVPDIADFDLFGVYPALDTAMALTTLLAGLSGNDEEAYLDVCKLSQASVSKVVEQELMAQNDEITTLMMQEHELSQYENDFLAELIETVGQCSKLDKTVVNQFKQRALADGVTNIGVEVE
jgi:uncharacterized protein YjaG (DUF416 family)